MDAILEMIREPSVGAVVALFAVVFVGGFIVRRLRSQRAERSLDELLARMPRWQRISESGPWNDSEVVSASPTLRTERRGGVRYAIEGPLAVTVGGREVELDATCFKWWYEQRDHGSGGSRTRYTRHELPVGLIRLPASLPSPISIRPEDLVSRLGLKHSGERFESEEFNRRFRVEADDPALATTLLDDDLQAHLSEHYRGRVIEITGDVLLLSGSPKQRDRTLARPIRELPGVLEDLRDLVGRMPQGFWPAIDIR